MSHIDELQIQNNLVNLPATMENYCTNWTILMDSSSIMDAAASLFWMNALPVLYEKKSKILIPHHCIEEIERISINAESKMFSDRAIKRLKHLESLLDIGCVNILEAPQNLQEENAFPVLLQEYGQNSNVLLITQDQEQAREALNLAAALPNALKVCMLDGTGQLAEWTRENLKKKEPVHKVKPTEAEKKGEPASANSSAVMLVDSKALEEKIKIMESRKAAESFKICSQIIQEPDEEIAIHHWPGEGSLVYAGKDCIYLEKEMKVGSRATVFTTNTPFVAKVFHAEAITKHLYEKLKLLRSKPLSFEGICFPSKLIYNENHEFVGYLMPRAEGYSLQDSVFASEEAFLELFPDWKKKDLVDLGIMILRKIIYLHNKNIVMGDINPENIMVVSPSEVYFIDTDRYQIERYPSERGIDCFTAPEIQGKDFAQFLRTIRNENYAIAVLMFRLLMCGELPYPREGEEELLRDIREMNFPYPYQKHRGMLKSDKQRYLWSHLPFDLKGRFYETFQAEGKYATEKTRLSAEKWLTGFQHYRELLDTERYVQLDAMSLDVFPTRYKNSMIKCRICGKETISTDSVQGICRECLEKNETSVCKRCGKEITYTGYQRYILGGEKYSLCPECYEFNDQIKLRKRCVECGCSFGITNEEYERCQNKGWDLPKRCHSCQIKKKKRFGKT